LNHTGSTVFAGVSAMVFDGTDYSPILTVKNGDSYIDPSPASVERWGDYSGAQRKYDEPGKVWIAGTFGTAQRQYGTWIAELSLDPFTYVQEIPMASEMKTFPNPFENQITVKFTMTANAYLYFEIIDEGGSLIRRVYSDEALKGENEFSFSTAPLAVGTYILRISNANETVLTQKIVKM
jgi:hypothetical protein